MFSFSQIERFLEKEIEKQPLPHEMGEGPAYVVKTKDNRKKQPARNSKGKHYGKRKPQTNAAHKGSTEGKKPYKHKHYKRNNSKPNNAQ